MQTNNFTQKEAQQGGFSLIELLIAMLISLILIFACTTLYSSLKSSISTSQKLAKAQESLRGSFYLLSRSLYQADGIDVSGTPLIVKYSSLINHDMYSCLGNTISSAGSTDSYFTATDDDGLSHLYCDDGSGEQLIALGVETLTFEAISHASGTIVDGVKVTMKIDGMPSSSYSDGLTFTLALRQKVLLDLTE
ncbi:PilW family protein [Psychromonas sp.]|uniref:PilW family protein n=1 Tax=Psychromonas sp. TaxID=1884585 RepID=UPI0039E54DE0